MQIPDDVKAKLSDQFWRLNNLYTCVDKDGKEQPFKMNPQQEDFFKNHHYLNIILKARQLGFSTLIEILLLDYALWYPNTACGVIADTLDNATSLFKDKLQRVYDNMDPSVKALCGGGGVDKQTQTEIYFRNGSSIRVGVSLRSSTMNYLHVSEFGKICAKYPDRAEEVVTGALNTVATGNFIFIESTAEGERGYFADYAKEARILQNRNKVLSKQDYKFFFYPWFDDPSYSTDDAEFQFTQEDLNYFLKLQNDFTISLTLGQKTWWAAKYRTQREKMGREFPSYPDEAFETPIEGAYYAKYIEKMEKAGQIGAFPYDPRFPVETAWDLGVNDLTVILFFQRRPNGLYVIDYYEDSGRNLEFYSRILRYKSTDPEGPGYTYSQHNMPHDIKNRDISAEDGDRKKIAEKNGIKPISVVKKYDVNTGIDNARTLMATCFIDEKRCEPLITALRNYRKEFNKKLQVFLDSPRHDQYSHASDAFRYLASSEEPFDSDYHGDFTPRFIN